MDAKDQPGLFADITMQNPMTPEVLAELSDAEIDFDEAPTETAKAEVDERVAEAASEPSQNVLFDKGEWWDEHWKQMPEFIQKDLMPFKTVMVHFETRKDMEAFAKLVEQTIHLTTPSIWYPEAGIQHWDKRYVDAAENAAIALSEAQDGDIEVFDSGDLA